MIPTSVAVHRVCGLVSAALSGEVPAAGDLVGVEDLVAAVVRHRVAEVLVADAARLRLAPELVGALTAATAQARRAATVQVLETGILSGLLGDAGVPHLFLKGPALAVQTTGSAFARGAGDIDVIVPPTRVEQVHSLLTAEGWQLRATNQVVSGTWAWRHVMSVFNALSYDGPRGAIDLHWRLDPSPVGLPDFDEVMSRRVSVELPGVRVATLAPADALSHSCAHAAKDGHRWLRSLVDVWRLAGLDGVWERPRGPAQLTEHERITLAVTAAAIGLPAEVPDGVREALTQVPRASVERALRRLEQPTRAAIPFPGAESIRLLGHLLRSGRRAGVGHALLATALPVQTVAGVEAPTAWTGVPQAVVGRVRRVGRRTVAWSRRVPGAGITEVRR